jgi:hypothetical protein
LDSQGLYDYLIYNYVNGLKEKLLNSTFPQNLTTQREETTAQRVYKAEDLTKEEAA